MVRQHHFIPFHLTKDSQDLLFVIGGLISVTSVGRVQLMDLTNDQLMCTTPANIPLPNYGSVAFKNENGLVTTCGGPNNDMNCFTYNPVTNEWETSLTTLDSREYASVTEMSGGSVWITGGRKERVVFYD